MEDKNKAKRVPKLRFKGFTDDWEQRKLGTLSDRVKSYAISHNDELEKITGTKYIHYGDIHTGKLFRITNEQIMPNIKDNNYRPLKNGDVVVADASEDYKGIADACVLDLDKQKYKIVAGLHTIAFRPNKYLNSDFLFIFLHTSIFKHYGYKIGTGLKVFGISYNNLANMPIKVPIYKEQSKISNLINLIEKIISLQQRKITELNQVKTALLQNIFGQKEPNVRIKNFTNNWKQYRLGEFGKNTGGTALEDSFKNKGQYKVISIGSYSEDHKYNDQGIRAEKNYKTQKRVLNKNDLTMILNDKTSDGRIIGSVLLIPCDNLFVYNQRTERIEPDQKKFNSNFLYYLLNSNDIRHKIIALAQGNTQIYVNWSSISKINYFIPNIKEQEKIVDLLNYISNDIFLQQLKLKKLEEIKLFLLQNMFI